jgi:O-antigen/teichoic acid export membrane protein
MVSGNGTNREAEATASPATARVGRGVLGSLLVTSLAGQGLTVVTGILSARLLGPDGRGQLAIALLWPGVLLGLTELGIQSTYAIMVAREPGAANRFFANGLLIASVQTGLMAAGSVLVLAFAIPAPLRPAAALGFLLLPFGALRSALWGMQRGLGSFGSFNVSRLAASVPYLGVLVLLAATRTPSVPAIVLAYVAGGALSMSISLWDLGKRCFPLVVDPERLRRSLASGVVIHLGNLASSELIQTDLLLASLVLTTTDLGYYAVGRSFMLLPSLIGNSFGIVALHEQAQSRDLVDKRRIVQTTVLTAPVVVVTAAAIPILVPVLFGSEFRPSILPAELLVLAGFAMSLRRVSGDTLRGRGRVGTAAGAEIIGLAVSVLLVIASQPASILSVAVAAVVGQGTSLALQTLWILAPALRHHRILRVTRGPTQAVLTVAGALTIGVLLPSISPFVGVFVVALSVALLSVLSVLLAHRAQGLVTGIFALALLSLPWNAVRLTDWMTLSDGLLVAGSLTLFAVGHRARPRAYRQILPIVAGVVVMIGGGVIGSYAGSDLVTGLGNMVRFGVAAAAVPVLLAWWSPSRQAVHIAVWAWVAGASVSAIVAVFQLIGGDYAGPVGLTTHYNTLAITALMATGPALCFAIVGAFRTRVLAVGVVVLLFFAVVISGSRAGLLGYVAVAAIFVLLTRRTALTIIGTGALAVGALAGYLTLSTENAVSRLFAIDPATVSGSNVARLAALQDNLNLALSHPFFGIGFELAGDAHNVFLQVLVSAGIVGLSGFLFLVHGVVSRAFRSIADQGETVGPESRMLTIGLVASFIGYLVAGLFQNALWDRYIWIVPGLLAVVGSLRYEVSEGDMYDNIPRKTGRAGSRMPRLEGSTP